MVTGWKALFMFYLVTSNKKCTLVASSNCLVHTWLSRQKLIMCIMPMSRHWVLWADLTKAFDTVSRAGLWKIMAKYGCPDKFIALVRQFHDGMLVRGTDNGHSFEPIAVTNGVKQGRVLAPTLFSIIFSAMLSEAFRDADDGITIRYRMDGKLLNLWRLQAKSKMKEATVRDLLFADDLLLMPALSLKYSKVWISFPLHVNHSTLPSAQRKLKWCSNQHPEMYTLGHPSLLKVKP